MKKRDQNQKLACIAVARVSGATEASRALSVPRRTVRTWLDQYERGEIDDDMLRRRVDHATSQYLAETTVNLGELVSKASEFSVREIERRLNNDSAEPMRMSEVRDLLISLGVAVDKLAVLRTQTAEYIAPPPVMSEEDSDTLRAYREWEREKLGA